MCSSTSSNECVIDDWRMPVELAPVLHRAALEVCEMAESLPGNETQQESVVESPQESPAVSNGPDEEEVARLAHQYWLERGSPIGTPEEDWFRAEAEIRKRMQ